jgi:competence protein ComEA
MLERVGTILVGLLIGLLAAGLVLLLVAEPRGQPVTLQPPPSPSPIRVHVTGAVQQPGICVLPPGSIVQDAIEAAGGSLPEARLDALNLAAPLADGQQVSVPGGMGATPPPPAGATGSPTPGTGRININTASAAELDLLPGIGPALAQNIIDYREGHGPFVAPEDLLDVPGIGPAKLSLIRDLITFE